MIVIYINGEGTAEKLSPQHVYQGSNQTGVTVFAPVPQTTALGIAFRLPDKTSTTYYPMTFIQSVEGLSQYEFTIPSSITQLAGQASIALRALFSDGQQTSQLIEFEIEPSVLPTLPEDIDQDAYDIIMQRLQEDRSDITTIQGQINGIEETADSAQKASAEAVETANNAESKIDGAIQEIAGYKTDVDTKIEELETQIAEGQGTIVEVDGKEQAKVTFDSDPQEQLDTTREQVKEVIDNYVKTIDFDKILLEKEYPVGGKPYIQFSNMQTPAERWAETTWEIDTALQGRTLIGSGGDYTLGATGGSADAVVVTHKHVQRVQKNNQNPTDTDGYQGSYPWGMPSDIANLKTQYCVWISSSIDGGNPFNYSEGYTTPVLTNPEGESGTDKNLPPYTVVNYWKRIA